MHATELETLEQRLGAPEELAELTAVEYRKTGFVQRHPWLTFVVAPIPAVILIAALFVTLFVGVAWMLDVDSTKGRDGIWLMTAMYQSMRFLPFAASAAFFCWLARRCERGERWALVACLLVALLAITYNSSLQLPAVGQRGQFSVGLSVPPSWQLPQLMQAAVPLMIGVLFLVYKQRQPRWA